MTKRQFEAVRKNAATIVAEAERLNPDAPIPLRP